MIVALGAVLAIVWANAFGESYFRFARALSFVVNDIGMAFFLALMTKEVVEATVPGGVLHTWRRVLMPVVAGVGGMLGSVIAYATFLQFGDEASLLARGWPVPCATDIAFSYFVARAIGKRYPAIPFLLLLGITVDALSLLIVEVQFPVADVHWSGAVMVAAAIGLSLALRRNRVRSFWPYLLIGGVASWLGFYLSGLNPVLALVPIVPFLPHAARDPGFFVETPPGFRDALSQFEYAWKYPVQIALFLFGLVNAGVLVRGSGTGTWSVLVAALIGKPVGILIAVALAVAAGLHLPHRVAWRDVIVVAFAASIGFTFALFLAAAAFPFGPILIEVKIGALLTIAGALVALGAAALLRVGRFAL
jgi:NhaA family Na+:H+ antiporter